MTFDAHDQYLDGLDEHLVSPIHIHEALRAIDRLDLSRLETDKANEIPASALKVTRLHIGSAVDSSRWLRYAKEEHP